MQTALHNEWEIELDLAARVQASSAITDEDILEAVIAAAHAHFQAKLDLVGAENFVSFERMVLLQSIDTHWREHLAASEHLGEDPSPNFVLLFDELEAHLHPRWQRSLLPSLLKIATTLTGNPSAQVQIIATTQSPLVLASIEPHFESSIDALWTLDKVDDHVEITRQSWQKRGDVVMWLVSEVFGETSPYSIEAEFVMNEARQLMSVQEVTSEQIESTRRNLCRVLSEFDPFWLHWRAWIRKIGDIYE